MTTTEISILTEIAKVQAARRENWNRGETPTDAKLESEHLSRIEELKEKLQ